jgi:hypothetical protein
MQQLQKSHFVLFRMLNEQFLFLNRSQVERILTQPKSSTKRWLVWLVSERYLECRRRADTFAHFQMPLYYLGARAWRMLGNPPEKYKEYRARIEQRSDAQLDHLLGVFDVLLKFMLEANVKRIIGGEDRFWHDSLSFEMIPDAWIQFGGGEAFIEVDRGTEAAEVVRQKIEKYISLKRFGNYLLHFPGCKFRLLFITTAEERIEALERLTMSDDIWFATMNEVLKEPLQHRHWIARNGFYALPVAPKEKV